MKNKAYEYYNDTYCTHVYLCIGTRKYFKKWLAESFPACKNSADEALEDETMYAMTLELHGNGSTAYCVYMPEISCDSFNVTTLTHELLHVTIGILGRRGIATEADNSEPAAYLLGAMQTYFMDVTKILNHKPTRRKK